MSTKRKTYQQDKDRIAKKLGETIVEKEFLEGKLVSLLLKDIPYLFHSKERKVLDGKGRATDNICIERFWRSIKYEEIYLNEYKNIKVLHAAISVYMDLYNKRRLHSAIGYQTPNEVYYQATNNSNSKGVKLLPQVS